MEQTSRSKSFLTPTKYSLLSKLRSRPTIPNKRANKSLSTLLSQKGSSFKTEKRRLSKWTGPLSGWAISLQLLSGEKYPANWRSILLMMSCRWTNHRSGYLQNLHWTTFKTTLRIITTRGGRLFIREKEPNSFSTSKNRIWKARTPHHR